ncbi:MAG: hypothetical protein Q4B26_16260 [Eubacteriales bacterium]|nr:hypothetical protein [Eubacteriales bacterium]
MKLKIIARLWSAVYDLLFYIQGTGKKTLEEIHSDLDIIEVMCRPYADEDSCEDMEGRQNNDEYFAGGD